MSSLRRLPPTVVVLGLVSFFNDLASEMVTPLIPLVLATVLGAGPVALGLIEGTAEAVASFLKLWSGRHSDWLGGRRKWLTFWGYLLSNVVRPFFGTVTGWPQLAALRTIDRVGKGIRTAPRDALVTDKTPVELRGLAYGFHRAMDNGGAMAGSLLAAAILATTSLDLTQVILLSALPGIVGVVLVAFAVKEDGTALAPAYRTPLPALRWRALPPALRVYFVVVGLFAFARASETFIVLRGHDLRMGAAELLLLWAAMSFAKAVAALRGGRLADRWGHVRVVQLGWAAHGASFGLIALLATTPATLWVTALLYGLATGFGEGAERAVVGELAPGAERGTAFGWYNMTLGLTAIPAGLVFGGVWQSFGAPSAFGLGAALALVAAAALRRVGLGA